MAPPVKSPAATRARRTGAGRKASYVPAEDADLWALLDEAGLGHDIGFMMRLAQLALIDYALPKNAGLDLTSSQRIIMRLVSARPGMTQQRIADALRIKRANLTPLLNELEAQGLVVRKPSAQSRRAFALQLTAKGERSLARVAKSIPEQGRCLSGILRRYEEEELLRLLRKIAIARPAPV
jgi:DNA-binding MarR family transcriptional regulator